MPESRCSILRWYDSRDCIICLAFATYFDTCIVLQTLPDSTILHLDLQTLLHVGGMDLISELLPELGSLPDFQPGDGHAIGGAAAALHSAPSATSTNGEVKAEFMEAHNQPHHSSSSESLRGWSTVDISEAASHHLPYATDKSTFQMADMVRLQLSGF